MLSFVDNFEGVNHRYFNRKQYRCLHLIPRKLNQFLNRVKALCLLCVLALQFFGLTRSSLQQQAVLPPGRDWGLPSATDPSGLEKLFAEPS